MHLIPQRAGPLGTPLLILVAVISLLGDLVIGGILVRQAQIEPTPSWAVVDLAKIVERQRLEVLKEGRDPEGVEREIEARMNILASLLSEIGKERVILNKGAVVSGKLPDISEEMLEQLSHRRRDGR
ncbi:MAG: TrbI F-type domain-containing protein [Nitrospiria bacterium]